MSSGGGLKNCEELSSQNEFIRQRTIDDQPPRVPKITTKRESYENELAYCVELIPREVLSCFKNRQIWDRKDMF